MHQRPHKQRMSINHHTSPRCQKCLPTPLPRRTRSAKQTDSLRCPRCLPTPPSRHTRSAKQACTPPAMLLTEDRHRLLLQMADGRSCTFRLRRRHYTQCTLSRISSNRSIITLRLPKLSHTTHHRQTRNHLTIPSITSIHSTPLLRCRMCEARSSGNCGIVQCGSVSVTRSVYYSYCGGCFRSYGVIRRI